MHAGDRVQPRLFMDHSGMCSCCVWVYGSAAYTYLIRIINFWSWLRTTIL